MHSPNAKPVVIFGTGALAELAWFYFQHDVPRVVAAFTVDRQYLKQRQWHGVPVVPFDELHQQYPASDYDVFVCVGYPIGSPYLQAARARISAFERVRDAGYSFVTYISRHAMVWDHAQFGANCFVMEANLVQPFSRIGDNVVMFPRNSIGHHAVIGDHSFLSGNVGVAANVQVGQASLLSWNTLLRSGLTIGEHVVVGGCCYMSRNAPPYSVWSAPEPARKRKITSRELRHL